MREGVGFVTAATIRGYCRELGLDYYSAIRYLLHNKYLLRILKGIFYVSGIEGRKLGKAGISHYEAISKAMEIKGIKNWYFALDTAASMNNLTHEFFPITDVISDTIARPRAFKILEHRVKFTKVSKRLFGFGVIEGEIPYSDPEKTVLDMIYIGRYRGLTNAEIEGDVSGLLTHLKEDRIKRYSKMYPKSVNGFVEGLM